MARKGTNKCDGITVWNYMSDQAKWANDLMLKYNQKGKDLENHVDQTWNRSKIWKLVDVDKIS